MKVIVEHHVPDQSPYTHDGQLQPALCSVCGRLGECRTIYRIQSTRVRKVEGLVG